MNYPTKMGTLEQQLSALRKQKLPLPETLNGRVIPKDIELNTFEEWIMLQWREIGQSRETNDTGPQPITDTQILAYIELMQEDLRLIDIKLIKDIDKEFISELAEQREINKD
ncbi:phage tail assembly chaperone [Sapientia aquatica]|jgi:hypothetical protein|uniref:Uncharacterized protein n=1 Tax=Sapientia aquatica TaxID=1549640 RepID=A0A4V3AU90_9BURK|nr:hypothetical protein [Sapientia aquatica]TDK63553.1 hypothetical protein E2I14_15240 [Sapientia aquatica]